MPLRGGEADKVGNRYELIWTVRCMTDIMNERADSMRLEPVGIEGVGTEFWLQKGEKKEYHQVKRQNGGKGYWSLSDLESYKILTRFAEKLQISENNYCVFVSQDSSTLRELVERAKNAESLVEFKKDFIGKGEYSSEFDEFCRRSGIVDERTAYDALKRIVIEPIGEIRLTETVEAILATLVEGNPETVRKILAIWAQEKVHKTLIALDIWKYLEEQDYSHSELGRGTRDFDAIEKQNQRYLSKIKESAIASETIVRDEVGIVLDKLQSSNGKRGVLISGEAGIGKSSVIVQVIEKLRDKNWPVLAFRVDRLNFSSLLPENVGQHLGLKDSPAKVLAAVSKGRDCVLVIDQLDTVSKASGRHHEFFECIEEIITQAMRYPQLKLMLACRKFDLDNDSRVRRLTGEKGVVDTISLNHLSDETVMKVVSDLGLDSRRLNKKQLKLLSIPLHLSLLSEISEDSTIETLDFDTATDLYHKFWEYKQEKTSQRLGEPIQIASLWNSVIDAICYHMSNHQVLYAPDYVIEDFANIARAMVSEHVLILDNKTYSFFHEGFFDYAFARRFIAQGQNLLSLLLSGEQHLFRRAQVRQLLLYEHDKECNRCTKDLDELLTNSKIRFHIKKMIFDIMKELDDPKEGDWKIIASFLGKIGNPCSREAMRVLWGSVPWFELLDSLGLVKKWLADEEEQIIERATNLMVGVQKKLPGSVAKLLEPYVDTGIYVDISEGWKKRLVWLMEFSYIDVDHTFFDFTLKLIDKGILDDAVSFNPFNDNFWYRHAHKLVDNHPDWAAQYIGHYLSRSLFRSILNGWRNPFERNIIPDNNRINNTLYSFLYGIAQSAPEELVLETLQFMLDMVTLAADYDTEAPYNDSIWKFKSYRGVLRTSESILKVVESGLSNLAKSKPESFKRIAEQLKNENFRTIQYLVIRSYAANGEQFSDDAAEFLCLSYSSGFENGYTTNSYWAARQLLEAITPYCCDDQLARLENLILDYYPDREKLVEDDLHRGYAQFVLLGGIYSPRLSIEASNRLRELSKKFGKLMTPDEMAPKGGFVRSPVSEKEAEEMNDEKWLEAIEIYNDRNNAIEIGDPFVGGAHQLSTVLEKQVRKDPDRFAKLVQNFPDTTHEYYFDAILRGIVDTPLDIKAALDVCRRCHQLPSRPFGRWICEPIAKLAELDLPNDAIDIITWYATEDPDPDRESWRAEKPGEVAYWGGDILSAGLNSARGVAAMAIGTLISFDQKRVIYLRPTLERMVQDPSISVRSWVALALNMIQDRDIAVKLFQRLCETEDILLGTNHVEDFLRYSLVTHFDALKPILERMLSSENLDVVKVGARQACLASLRIDDAKLLAKGCLLGTKTQRLGAAEVFAANIRTHPVPCIDNLILLFNDESDDVKSEATGCFRHFKDDDLGEFVSLIEAFIKSPAFKISESDLVWALEKTTAEIPEITYRVCELLIETIDSGDKKERQLEENDISTLILRLYGQKNTSEELKKNCLDLIDRIMQMESYGLNRELDEGLSLFDR